MYTGHIYTFTSAAINYLPKARQLCRSIKQHHPEFKVCLALADEVPESFDLNNEPFDAIIPIADLDIPDLRSWIFRHSLVELCTAIKPFVLRRLLRNQEVGGVLYFDPDMVLFSRLDDLCNELEANSILLTPHITKPEKTIEAIIDNEICALRHGLYNLGFIGVKNSAIGHTFAEWWCERCGHFNFAETENGLFVDQKWIDFVPIFFAGVKILHSPRFNVATWNLTTRKLEGNFKDNFLVDGEPLGFYHFTGFDSGAHESMAGKYQGGNKAVRSLIQWYKRNSVNQNGSDHIPWAYDRFENEVSITQAHRVIYRRRVDLQKAFRDPFKVVENGHCYYNWFQNQASKEYPEMFSTLPPNNNHPLMMQQLMQQLDHHNKIDCQYLWYQIVKAFRTYRWNVIPLSYRAMVIFWNEGIQGLYRRLK